jgi:hypothetical protein
LFLITATWVNGTLIREIRNNTGATLTKGTIVYISGATGNKPTVSKAIATGDSTSAQTFGFVQENIANNANGYVVVIGDLTGVDTSAFTEGDQLYLSSTTAGAFTSTKQYAPNHLVYVGIVTRSHPTLGQIEVNIQNGYEMDELHNVAAQSPSNGDILQYVTSTGLWTKIAGTTTNISEGTNLYFTDARARAAISLTTTGTSGAATYTSGVLNIPQYQSVLTNPVTGTGSTNYLPKFTGSSALGNSNLVNDTIGNLGLGITPVNSYTPSLSLEMGANGILWSEKATSSFNSMLIGLNSYFNSAGNPLYKNTGLLASRYTQSQGAHIWDTAPSGTANAAITFVTNMRLDANGQLGLGVTPSAWSGFKALQTVGGSMIGAAGQLDFWQNAYFDGASKYYATGTATRYGMTAGQHRWYNAVSGSANAALTWVQAMTLDASGQLLIGTTTSSTFKLDVVGTARVSSNLTAGLSSATGTQLTLNALYSNGITFLNTNVGVDNRNFRIITDQGVYGTFNIQKSTTQGGSTYANLLAFEQNGGASFVNGLALSNSTAPSSGIQFPATQVASASANNLDDYEEGTWTIGITFGGASVGITYGQNTGTYTKVGRQVTVNGYVNLTNKGTSTGITKITGLPFTIPNSVANYSSASLWYNNIAVVNELINLGVINTTTIGIEQISTLGVITSVSDTNFTNTSAISISFTYFV